MSILVVDVGSSVVRVVRVNADGEPTGEHRRHLPPDTPAPGLVEFDAARMAETVLELVGTSLREDGPAEAIGVTSQRASTVVWNRETGQPLAPAQGWQDLRTLGTCLALSGEGLRLAPNQSATKVAAILDLHDPDRKLPVCVGTVDSWVVWALTGGGAHLTDATNAAVTGLFRSDAGGWDSAICDRLGIDMATLPTVVPSIGVCASATAVAGSPPIAGIAGDQQASLVGQGCVRPGATKITFGTGGMLDVCLGARPELDVRGGHGCFPIVAWRQGEETVWGAEGIMLSAGSNVDWLVHDLGILDDPADSDAAAAACSDTGGVVYVPAQLGLGTPWWDYGARGTLLGLTRGTGRAEITRAVLEGVAQRGADLVLAAEADTGAVIDVVRIDGGMSRNRVFVEALANATERPVEVSPVTEATALGAAFLAGIATGRWESLDETADLAQPADRVEPNGPAHRDRWESAVARARGWHPELSALDF